jgi:hypothetical protein
VVVDPTFGYTSIGVNTEFFNENYYQGCKFALSEACTIDSFSLYTDASITGLGKGFRMGVYDSAGDLVLGSVEVTTGNGWLNFSPNGASPTLTAGDYWIIWHTDLPWDNANNANPMYDSGAANTELIAARLYSLGLPATITPSGAGNKKFSIYATYTVASTYSPKTRSSLPATMMTMLNSKMLFG